jgi:putative heme iron utilization protein
MEHGRPAARAHEEPATIPARAPTHAERCRTLAAAARSATLCTLARSPAGFPYGSLVTVAFDDRGRPLMFLSQLAEHTGNLVAHSETSLLVSERLGEGSEPLALGRMTLLGHARRIPDDDVAAARAVFLAAQPSASYYIEFDDFAFYRQEVDAIRYVGGFGRMSWVDAADYARAEPDPLATASAGILAHMNDEHGDAMIAYARAFAKVDAATKATMTAVDRYGFEMSVVTPDGPRVVRLAFDDEVKTTDEVRKAMVVMVKKARAALG